MTLEEILIESSSYLDQANELPTGDDYDVRVSFANKAINEWQSAYRFSELRKKYVFSASTLATVPLPTDFSVMSQNPQELRDNNNWITHELIDPKETYIDAPLFFCYQQGNPKEGYSLWFNNLAVGATVTIDYYKTATSLTTLTDVPEMSDPNYISESIIAGVLEARGDDRFPIVRARAQARLNGMVGDNQSGATPVTRVPKMYYKLGRR